MKWSLLPVLLMLNFALYAQPVLFTDRSDMLERITGFASFSDCVVDLNGDYLDDVVRVGEKGIFIDYQRPDGTFEHTIFHMAVLTTPSWSICAADLDNNGYNDMLFAGSESVSFMLANENATAYTEQLMPGLVESQRSTLADINNDGMVDGFVCNETGRSVPFRNTGDGIMVRDTSLIVTSPAVGNYAAIWTDYDNDSDIDLYLSKCWVTALPGDTVRTNLLYRNNGDGTYTEVAPQANVDDNAQTWSTAFEDFDNDGDFDAFVANHDFANRLFRNNGDGTFTDIIQGSGIDPLDLIGFETWGADFNNDGNIDLFTDLNTNLYLGNGDMTFTGQVIPVKPGAIGDLNADGALDVVEDQRLWINNGNDNHWVKVNTIGLISNRNGIGAGMEIYGNWGMKIREIRSGQGYSPMNSLTTHFGLGEYDHIDSLIIKWPSGIVTTVYDLKVDTTYLFPEATCITNVVVDATTPLMLCPGEDLHLLGPDQLIDYQWSNGDSTKFALLSNSGIYFLIGTDSMGCKGVSNFIEVDIIEDVAPVITALPGTTFCEGDTITLISTQGENYRWSQGTVGSRQISVTEGGTYTVAVDAVCEEGQITSLPFEVLELAAPVPESSQIFVFPGDSVLLIASGVNVHWYDQPVGGTLLHEGPELQTGELSADVTYYIESHHEYASEMQTGGKTDTTGGGGLPAQDGALLFYAWEPFTLDSVTVYVPVGGPLGVRFVQLVSGDSVLASASFMMQEGANVLALDFEVPAGHYALRTPQGNLFRNNSNVNYPYEIGNVGQITNSTNGPDHYYYFYDWHITKPAFECISSRVPFQVVVSSVKEANDFFKIYPNPADNMVIIENLNEGICGLTIYNNEGKKLQEITVRDERSVIEIAHLLPGIYIIELTDNRGAQKHKLIIH